MKGAVRGDGGDTTDGPTHGVKVGDGGDTHPMRRALGQDAPCGVQGQAEGSAAGGVKAWGGGILGVWMLFRSVVVAG